MIRFLINTIILGVANLSICFSQSNEINVLKKFGELYAKTHPVITKPFEQYPQVQASEWKAFNDYALQHWKVLLEDVDRLPVRKLAGETSATTASQISEICERLPPLEYLELLNRLLDLVEQEKIFAETAHMRFMGTEEKNYFIIVNFEHSEVKKLIERARMVCAHHPEMMNSLDLYASGKLADNYQVNSGDDFFPQTLPGIKLRHPDEKLISRYERMTGKLITRESGFEDIASRPSRRMEELAALNQTSDETTTIPMKQWIIGCAGLLLLLFVAQQIKRKV